MTTLLLIILGLGIAAGVVFLLMKSGKIQDKDGNNIPDSVDEKVQEIKETVVEVKKRVKNVKEETLDVVKAVKEVGKQAKQVVKVAKGETKKGRPRKKD